MTQSAEEINKGSDGLSYIDLSQIVNIVWEGKRFVIGLTALLALSAVFYSLSLTNYYRSESILVAADSQDLGSMSQYSGLASLAGVRLPNAGGDGIVEIIEIIKSREFVKHLLSFEEILPSLMAPESYNQNTQELIYDARLYNTNEMRWIKGAIPSYLEVHETYIGEVLTISEDKITGLISITVEHISPVFARDFLMLIIAESNNLKREKDIDTSNKSINHLKAELSNTSLIEIKESINQLVRAQLEKRMMANANEDYSLAIIEPPFIPEKKSKPSRALICIVATMLGGILSVLILLIRHYFFTKKPNFS